MDEKMREKLGGIVSSVDESVRKKQAAAKEAKSRREAAERAATDRASQFEKEVLPLIRSVAEDASSELRAIGVEITCEEMDVGSMGYRMLYATLRFRPHPEPAHWSKHSPALLFMYRPDRNKADHKQVEDWNQYTDTPKLEGGSPLDALDAQYIERAVVDFVKKHAEYLSTIGKPR